MNIKWIVELVALGWHLALEGGLSPSCFVLSLCRSSRFSDEYFYSAHCSFFGEASYAAFSLFPSCASDLTAQDAGKKISWNQLPSNN
jgi:hypothetical protein